MPVVSQPVEDWHVGVVGKLLNIRVGRTAVFDAVEHGREHASGIGD